MTESEINKLTDELIDAKLEVDHLQILHSNLREDYAGLEISWHQLKDDYSALARALGVPGDAFWGDPLVAHADVLARAKELAGFARVA